MPPDDVTGVKWLKKDIGDDVCVYLSVLGRAYVEFVLKNMARWAVILDVETRLSSRVYVVRVLGYPGYHIYLLLVVTRVCT